ncbi:MAG TPA: GtrA family protein [Casimicrobiaceae bacterium]|nr:GtrA family protein [Casimicrobiaceae bacterium]
MEREGNRSLPADFVRFAIVGGIGFIVDAGILSALVSWFGLNVYASRAVSFSIAVLATWALNRQWVFGDWKARHASAVGAEYVRYVVVQTVGALTNLAVFVAVLVAVPDLIRYPVVPLAIGAVAGLLVNFAGARLWVFARNATLPKVR